HTTVHYFSPSVGEPPSWFTRVSIPPALLTLPFGALFFPSPASCQLRPSTSVLPRADGWTETAL
ncbi:MAG TPA: hypothetical protein VM709_05255, partial [Candidatus Sulfotelmatobacter sp.]|nr:hypothetical protein [Candidatus Sulfotelmatobacter sp.]